MQAWRQDNSWKLKASCRGANPELFEIAEDDSNIDFAESFKRFQEAKKICRNCPVKFECNEAATDDDFTFTYRAGKEPASYVMAWGKHGPDDMCAFGHTDGRNKYGRCFGCTREAARQYYLRKTAA